MVADVLSSLSAPPLGVSWSLGEICGVSPFDLRPVDVRLSSTGVVGAGKGRTWQLQTALEPLRSRFVGGDGTVVEVQNFRYTSTDGVPRRLLVCGGCGHTVTVDSADFLARSLAEVCRKCGAGFSGPCVEHHAYGSCGRCGGGTLGVP